MYYPRVFAYVYSRTGDVGVTIATTAEVFERAYTEILETGDIGPVSLFSTARRLASRAVRMRISEPAPRIRLVVRPAGRDLQQAYRDLPERDQELLALRFDAGLSYAQIGEILGMTPESVQEEIVLALGRLYEDQ